ncbi:MAG: hypothetical protein RSA22_07310 [Acinetobacter sp.]
MASLRLKRLVKQRQAQNRVQYHVHSQLHADYAKSVKVDFVATVERNLKVVGNE